jgi:hypothetical protein
MKLYAPMFTFPDGETVICPTGNKVFGSVPVNNGQRRWSIK